MKIDSLDKAMNTVLEGSDLNEFIKQTQENNLKLNRKVKESLTTSSELKNKMDLIRRALVELNSQ